MNTGDTAVALFKEGYSCSQAVLTALAGPLGLEREQALRVAGGFGGGIGRLGETCGAVTGAVMALGLRYGPTKGGDLEGKERIYGRVRELVKRFEARHEHSHCRDLLGGEIRTPEGYARAKEQRVFLERCPNYVRDAAGFAEELL